MQFRVSSLDSKLLEPVTSKSRNFRHTTREQNTEHNLVYSMTLSSPKLSSKLLSVLDCKKSLVQEY